MNQTTPSGPGIMLRVYPGDTVEPSVYAYHENSSGYGTSSTGLAAMAGAFGGANGGGGESQAIYDTFNEALGVLGLGGNRGDGTPAAYLNYLFFDELNGFDTLYQHDDYGWEAVPSSAYYNKTLVQFDHAITIKKPGYIYIYLSYENESNNWVYFDDLKVAYTKSKVVQSNNYYPFGLQTSNSWTRIDTKPNQYLYNAGSELNDATGSYEMAYRGYDPAIGRMSGVDPMVNKYASMTPYNYSMNDPIYYNDPTGAEYEWASMGGCGCWRDKGPQDGGGQSNGVYGSNWNAATYGGGFVKYGAGTHDYAPTWGEINARNWVRAFTGNQGFKGGQTLTPYTTSLYLGEEGQLWGNEEGTLFGERGSPITGTLLWTSHANERVGKDKPWLGWYFLTAFVHPELTNTTSDMISPSGSLTGVGMVTAATGAGLRLESRIAVGNYYLSAKTVRATALKSAKYLSNIGKVIGVAGAFATLIEGAYDSDGLSGGDIVKSVFVGGMVFTGTIGIIYTAMDVGTYFYSGVSITDRIGVGYDYQSNH
ncbi:MAG: hypothetical protein H6580_00350 [Flammeovirgaceae bacterium]|nr:hypothetical protein [Flammeovirgaceae bacterium]